MKKALVIVCTLIAVAFVGCQKKAATGAEGAAVMPPTGSEPDVVAKVGGEEISAKELEEAARSMLQSVAMKVYQVKKNVLDGLIDEKLLTAAAKKEGVTIDDYVKKHIDDKVVQPTDEEIKSVYEARKGKDAPPFAEVKKQIGEYLVQAQRMKLHGELVSKLRSESEVKVYLDPPRVEVEVGDAPTMGPKDAKVTVIEFSDYECPFCGREREVVWQLVDKYKDKIRYVFKDFPLSFHRNAPKAAEAARCAGDQGKYWEYNKKAFENQKNLTIEDLKRFARELGIDAEKFNKCLDDGVHAGDVQKSIEQGSTAGVSGTPAYFINGIMISGAQPIDAFTEIIDAELEK